MVWQDDLAQDYFEDIPIEVVSISLTGIGRQVEIVRAINKGKVDYQDLDVLPRQFSITLELYGDDYKVKRDKLFSYLRERQAPYSLTLWNFRPVKVAITEPKSDERRDELGKCTISFEATVFSDQDSAPKRPKTSPRALIQNVKNKQIIKFGNDYKPPKGNYLSGINKALRQATSTLATVNGKIASALGPINELSANLRLLKTGVTDLLNAPNALASSLAGLIGSTIGLLALAKDVVTDSPGFLIRPLSNVGQTTVDAMEAIFSDKAEDFQSPSGNGPEPEQAKLQKAALNEIFALIRVVTLAEVGALFIGPDRNFSTADEVEKSRDQWIALSRKTRFSGDVDSGTFSSMALMEGEVYKSMTDLSNQLPRGYTISLSMQKPSMVLAWELYADSNKRYDILGLNPQIRTPETIPAGEPIKVLSYDPI